MHTLWKLCSCHKIRYSHVLIWPLTHSPGEPSLFAEQMLGFLLKFQYSKHPEGKEKASLASPSALLHPLPSKQGIISKLTVGKPAWLQNTQEQQGRATTHGLVPSSRAA